MRCLTCAAAIVFMAGCASPGMPPGGPEDHAPPKLISVSPDTNSTNQKQSSVTFRFDEVVSERPSGAQSLDRMIIVSPSDGAPRVRWRRSAIQVRPRRSLRPNTTYTVTILPGMTDLRGNTQTSAFTTTFSTGPELLRTRLSGVVFDWVAGRPAPKAYVQAFVRGDTTFSWIAQADSAGRFELRSFPSGTYLLRAVIDANDNRGLDPREAWDSAGVAVADSGRVEMYAFVHDTVGPRIDRISVTDSVTLSIDFDKAVDPSSPLTPATFIILAADSTPTSVTALVSDSTLEAERAARAKSSADSARARGGRDATRADSAADRRPTSATDSRVPLPTPGRGRGAAARTDTTALPKPSRPSPTVHTNLRLGAPLKASTTYRLRATGVRGLLGNARTSDKVFITPKPPAPPDTTRRATADSVGRRARPAADTARVRIPPDTTRSKTPAAPPRRPRTR